MKHSCKRTEIRHTLVVGIRYDGGHITMFMAACGRHMEGRLCRAFPLDEIMDTCVFRVSLIDDYEELECWREIEVPGTSSLFSLAAGIVEAFEFDFDHAFGFYENLTGYYFESAVKYELFVDMSDEVDATDSPKAISVKKTTTAEAFTELGQKMQFLFDYGDEWRFLIELLRVGKKTRGKRYPLVLKMVGQAPEQYPDWDEDDDDQ